jgi:hypothetical protein
MMGSDLTAQRTVILVRADGQPRPVNRFTIRPHSVPLGVGDFQIASEGRDRSN